MRLKLQVLKESARTSNNVEYVTVTGMEQGAEPLLQMVDYNLRSEEAGALKGKLTGKTVEIVVENIRGIFAGRPQLTGRIVEK